MHFTSLLYKVMVEWKKTFRGGVATFRRGGLEPPAFVRRRLENSLKSPLSTSITHRSFNQGELCYCTFLVFMSVKCGAQCVLLVQQLDEIRFHLNFDSIVQIT